MTEYADAALLSDAQKIFGSDLVKEAYIEAGSEKELGRDREQIRYDDDGPEPQLDIDGVRIVLVFVNGRRVEFGSSEWGWINLVNPTPPF